MRLPAVCFLLLLFDLSVKAQEKETCFYHVSFYEWSWNYCYGLDTTWIYDSESTTFRDTIIMDTAYHPHIFSLKMRDSTWFNWAHFQVSSMDGKIHYQIEGFVFTDYTSDSTMVDTYYEGAYLDKIHFKYNFLFENGVPLMFKYLKIFDPELNREIILPKILIFLYESNR